MVDEPIFNPLLLRLDFVLLVPLSPVFGITTGIVIRDFLERVEHVKTSVDGDVLSFARHRPLFRQCLDQERNGRRVSDCANRQNDVVRIAGRCEGLMKLRETFAS